jgi:hypothetical protein
MTPITNSLAFNSTSVIEESKAVFEIEKISLPPLA